MNVSEANALYRGYLREWSPPKSHRVDSPKIGKRLNAVMSGLTRFESRYGILPVDRSLKGLKRRSVLSMSPMSILDNSVSSRRLTFIQSYVAKNHYNHGETPFVVSKHAAIRLIQVFGGDMRRIGRIAFLSLLRAKKNGTEALLVNDSGLFRFCHDGPNLILTT